MREPIVFSELHTLIVGLAALGAGATITYRVPGFRELGMPISVTGGVLVALVIMLLRVGFGLASMPVAFATMEEAASRYGPSTRAFLVITLAGSFFVDLANATVTKLFMMLPIFG